MEGSRSGRNSSHLWLDACAYGVGAGLLQGPFETTAIAADTHYTTLGLNTWCTKQDVERRYHERRQANNLAPVPGRAGQWLEAHETLSSDELRQRYDESLGLAARCRSRIDHRPLGFFSKSLPPAEQSWTTWERELLAVIFSPGRASGNLELLPPLRKFCSQSRNHQ